VNWNVLRGIDTNAHLVAPRPQHHNGHVVAHLYRFPYASRQYEHVISLEHPSGIAFSQKSPKSIFALYVRALENGSTALKTLRSRRHRALCAALVTARKAAKLSQHDLAARMRTSQTAIARIEIGERRVDVVEFLDLAKALHIDPHQLLAKLMA